MREQYVSCLEKTNFPNPEYRAKKLKSKIEKYKDYQGIIGFTHSKNNELTGKFQSCLIYNRMIKLDCAVTHAFQSGQSDMIKDVGLFLRQSVLNPFSNSEELPWPPLPSKFSDVNDYVPIDLKKFLGYVMFGSNMASAHQSEIRLIGSIGQDLCRAATRGQWKLPKHIFLFMTLHHLLRSKELTTLINRFGHCESYSFSLEVETAIAKALEETSSLLSNQIVRNPAVPSVFHSDFDNFDQFVNDLSGAGFVHTANGIMLQDFEEIDLPSKAGGDVPDIRYS